MRYPEQQRQTWWQRFWSSPFMWAALAVLFVWDVNFHHIGWNLNLFNLVLGIYCWSRCFHYADERWGKP